MKHKHRIILPLSLVLAASAPAAVIVTSSLTAPATDAADQYYLPGVVANLAQINGVADPGANDESTFVSERSSKIMSFTTGNNVGGYELSSITVQQVQWPSFVSPGTFANIPNGTNFSFRFGTISGTTLTPTFTTATAGYTGTAISQAGTAGTGFFLTFDLTGETLADLAANTNYFFEITRGTDSTAYFEMNSTSVNGYAGGQAYRGDNGGVLDANNLVNALPGDFAFHANLTAIPEPSAALLGGLGMLALLRRRR